MQTFLFATFVLRIGLMEAFSIKERQLFSEENTGQRQFTDIKGCISMHNEEGDFRYTATGSDEVCGLYLVGEPDTTIDIVFHHMDVNCADGGLIALVDGWEAKGEFFPGEWDSRRTMDKRYRTYCGRTTPHHFRSAQNVALIQHRIRGRLQGFTMTVRFVPNNRPCNAISMAGGGTWALSNFGQKVNCSFSMLTPQHVEILNIDVGTNRQLPEMGLVTGISRKCTDDRLELLGGVGLDPSYMWLEDSFCGQENQPRQVMYLPCPHSVVRLASSGVFNNTVTFRFRPLTRQEKTLIGPVEC